MDNMGKRNSRLVEKPIFKIKYETSRTIYLTFTKLKNALKQSQSMIQQSRMLLILYKLV